MSESNPFVVNCDCGLRVTAPSFTHAEKLRENHCDNCHHGAIVQHND